MVYFFGMLFGQCNGWTYWQALCHIVNLTMPPIGPRETNEGRWLINPSCIFSKLITADYKLNYNMKVSVICNKASKVSLALLYFENSTIGTDFTSAFTYDLRGLMLAKSGICPATFSPKCL